MSMGTVALAVLGGGALLWYLTKEAEAKENGNGNGAPVGPGEVPHPYSAIFPEDLDAKYEFVTTWPDHVSQAELYQLGVDLVAAGMDEEAMGVNVLYQDLYGLELPPGVEATMATTSEQSPAETADNLDPTQFVP